jgi:hypothetical protein
MLGVAVVASIRYNGVELDHNKLGAISSLIGATATLPRNSLQEVQERGRRRELWATMEERLAELEAEM